MQLDASCEAQKSLPDNDYISDRPRPEWIDLISAVDCDEFPLINPSSDTDSFDLVRS